MSQWKKVDRCKVCGKIYSTPRRICKCGTELRYIDTLLELFTNRCFVATNNCEKVIAKRKWFKWIVKTNHK